MRTTLSIDDDILSVAKSLADARHVSIGEVISDLARRGLQAPVRLVPDPETGWLMFDAGVAAQFGPSEVERALNEEDAEQAVRFRPE